MRPTDYIASLFKPSGGPGEEPAAYDFDPISSYFYNRSAEEEALQTIDAETTADLDLNAVFEQIDRTTSRVGQQYLYARLRTLRGEEDAADFDRRVGVFENDDELTQRCAGHLARLSSDDAYDFQRLIFDTPVKVRRIGLVYALTTAAIVSLLLAPFYPLLLLLFMAIYAVNLVIHYGNKLNITRYAFAVRQLAAALKTARYPASEQIPGSDDAAQPIRRVAQVEHRSRIVGAQGDGGNDFAAIAWLVFELVKIAFNIETILFHRFTGSITAHREAIHDVFRFIGETDAAISVMRLRRGTPTCRPTFIEGKYLEAVQVVHPLIPGCVANTLTLDGTGLLLTGSNMSGKTTFVRTVMLNALLGETICTCFAEGFTAPYMRLHSSIRIADDVSEGTSYYLQEVLTVKRLLEAAEQPSPCLFVLDELFKGTNTTERIAAGKAVLARLNRGPHIVLAATHDIELAELLRGDDYELHHFREEVADGQLVFDYRLHTGPLTTRNAIRILELYDYPPELIAEALDTQERLLGGRDTPVL